MPTIGVAVAIPEPWGPRLQAYRRDLGDVTADLIPTHITLVPPTGHDGDVADVVAHLEEAAAAQAAFPVRLRGTDTFRPVSPVVFVALADGATGCERLADVVRRGPLAVDLAFPYHPHVTVAHHLPDADLDRAAAELADFEADFTVADFQLYVHEERRGWEPTRSFTLQGPLPAPDLGR